MTEIRFGGMAWGVPLVALLVLLLPTPAEAQLRGGVVFDRDGLRALHIAIGEVYRTPIREVQRWGPSRIHPDELPVVYFLSHEARVSPETVIALRERGWSWMEVTGHLGLSPNLFVRHLPRTGPPFGRAHGYWARHSRQAHRLSDREIVDYVHLALWSQYHRQPVERVIRIRDDRGSWAGVSHYVGTTRQPAQTSPGPPARTNPRPPVRTNPGPPVQMKEPPGRGRGGPPPGRGPGGRGPGGH